MNVSRETYMNNINVDNYIDLLYDLVKKSYKLNEIPVGSIVILDNKVVGKGYNNRQSSKNVCGHAEVNAVLDAEKYVDDWRLDNCILISTLKPCEMCHNIIKEARINTVFYLFDQNTSYNDDNYIKCDSNSKKMYEIEKIFNQFFTNLRK